MKQISDGRKAGAIKRAVENHIHPKNHRSDFFKDYTNWYAGVTSNTLARKAQHKRAKNIRALHFHAWDAGTVDAACEIERHFHKLGMKDKHTKGGVRPHSTYVYVFKIHANIFDGLGALFGMIE